MTAARARVLEMDRAFGVEGTPCRTARATQATEAIHATQANHATPALRQPQELQEPQEPRGRQEPAAASLVDLQRAFRAIVEMAAPRAARLERLREAHDAGCPHCCTATGHTRLVFGEGDPEAALMFVGEAPGETEDQLGRPFVGRAGKKLDEMIGAMGLSREGVYIANVLKSRPPENRTPTPEEADRCGCALSAQVAIIGPRCIVALGGPAAKYLLRTETGITKLRGNWASLQPPEWLPGQSAVPVMPTFHPAYLLRNYTVETRQLVWSDLQQALTRLRRDS